MVAIVTREIGGSAKGSPLTNAEMDNNLINLNNGKQENLGFTPLNAAEKGAASGVAPLGADSKVPASYLPSYVDDVLEFANFAAFPAIGETGKIYIDIALTAQYRWSGSAYVAIVSSPGSTDSVSEGTTNLYFTAARVIAAVLTGFSSATATAVAATDSVLDALGKLQGQINTLTTALAAKLNLSGGKLTGALNEATPATIASAAAVSIGTAASNTINVTGTVAITSLGTGNAGDFRRVIFADALTLTHNASSLILPTNANITTAADDVAEFVSLGGSNWKCINYGRKSGSALVSTDATKMPLAGGTYTGRVTESVGTALASAATVNLSTATGNTVHITGTTTITALTVVSGLVMRVIFDASLTLTHNATSLILPGGANIQTAAGDTCFVIGDGTNARVLAYQCATGMPVGSTFATRQTLPSVAMPLVDKGTVATGTVTFDVAAAEVQRLQVGGALTLAVSNWAAINNRSYLCIKLVNGGSAAVTITPTINWVLPSGLTTTSVATYMAAIGRSGLQSAGTDHIIWWTDDAGTTTYGKVI